MSSGGGGGDDDFFFDGIDGVSSGVGAGRLAASDVGGFADGDGGGVGYCFFWGWVFYCGFWVDVVFFVGGLGDLVGGGGVFCEIWREEGLAAYGYFEGKLFAHARIALR